MWREREALFDCDMLEYSDYGELSVDMYGEVSGHNGLDWLVRILATQPSCS